MQRKDKQGRKRLSEKGQGWRRRTWSLWRQPFAVMLLGSARATLLLGATCLPFTGTVHAGDQARWCYLIIWTTFCDYIAMELEP